MPRYLRLDLPDPDAPKPTISDVQITTDLRTIKLLKHGDPTDPEKVTGRIVKHYADLTLTIVRSDRKRWTREFTLHEVKGLVRVIDRGRTDKDRSVLLIQFQRDMEKAYPAHARAIVSALLVCYYGIDPDLPAMIAKRHCSADFTILTP